LDAAAAAGRIRTDDELPPLPEPGRSDRRLAASTSGYETGAPGYVRSVRPAAVAVGVCAALVPAGCGSAGDDASPPATQGTTRFHEVTFQELFPTTTLQVAYRVGYGICYEYAKAYDYTSMNAYLHARLKAATGTEANAELSGCSDANSETPLKGSGIPTVPYDQDYP
jgi:hypothetical protein